MPCVVREVPCPLVKREGPSEMEPRVAREVPRPLKEQQASVPISEVRGSERMDTRDVWRRGVGTDRGSEWLSWDEVVELQISDHQPPTFDVPGTEASVLTWNIMRKCRTAPRSNNGFNMDEDDTAYETRLRAIGKLLVLCFSNDGPGIACLQEAPSARRQQGMLLEAVRACGHKVFSRDYCYGENTTALTLWDTARWKCDEKKSAQLLSEFGHRSVATALEPVNGGQSIGFLNAHMPWQPRHGQGRPQRYEDFCGLMAEELHSTLSSWRADVAVAVGDFNMDVSDIDVAACLQGLDLRAHVVHKTCCTTKGRLVGETRDGMVYRAARRDLVCAPTGTSTSSGSTSQPMPKQLWDVAD